MKCLWEMLRWFPIQKIVVRVLVSKGDNTMYHRSWYYLPVQVREVQARIAEALRAGVEGGGSQQAS